MDRRALLALLLIFVMVAPAALAANPKPQPWIWSYDSDAVAKIHPVLAKKLAAMDPDQEIVVVFRLAPLPSPSKALVKGDYHRAVSTLKAWAHQTQEPVINLIQRLGGKVLRTFWIDNVILARVKAKYIPVIANDPRVVEVFENFMVHIIEPVAKRGLKLDPHQSVSSWGIFKIDAPGAWAQGYMGDGVRIAILDTGVDITHPALQGKMFTVDPGDPYYPGGWMEFDSDGNPVCSEPHDTHGHGTHTSGTALGGDTSEILIGVAPHAQLMHGLVLPSGSGTFAQVLAGIEWAVDPYDCNGNPTGYPAHVISMSLGASNYYGNELLPGIKNALLANIIVVAAIGNDGPDTSSNPGNIWGVFGVGATDQNDQVAWFSSGEVVNWPSPPSDWPFYDTYPSTYIKPDFSAPGVGITSAVPGGGYEAWDGTSMATPHVAGTVALILQAMGVLDFDFEDLPETVYEILNATSVDLGDPGQDTRYGWGRINASAAVALAQQYAKISGVEGYVYDAVDSSPVKWAKVYVVEVNKTYTVNNEGYFKIPLDPGNYTLVFYAWGYQNKTITVEVIILNGTIVGQVVDAKTGDPIPGANVTLVEYNQTVTTDVNGTFTFNVEPGTYTLFVEAEGYFNATVSVNVGENETVVVQIPLEPKPVNGTIAGYVVDASTGDPIAGALVWVYVGSTPVYTQTNASGYFELTVPEGDYTLYAFQRTYYMNYTNITVIANDTVTTTVQLTKAEMKVVILGNVHYKTQPHLANITAAAGFNVVEYVNYTDLLADWLAGTIYPKVLVIDHWTEDRYTTVPLDDIKALFSLARLYGTSIIFLDTSYSGYTGARMLTNYESDLEAEGYPVPDSYSYDYPSPENVLVYALDANNTIFQGVEWDGANWFYLADVNQSSWADYIYFEFTDDNVSIIALINDTSNNVYGAGIAEWTTSDGVPWFFLASWGESYWMQYVEPGSDGLYSNNTMKVYLNAVGIANSTPISPLTLAKPSPRLLEGILGAIAPAPVKPSLYTHVEVYLERQPYGYVTGTVVDDEGNPIAGATVKALGTPVSVETDENGTFTMWLPEGSYTLEVSAEAYYTEYLNVTVTVNATVDVGFVVLTPMPRIAILYDYQLGSFLESQGYYVVSYTDPYQLANDVAAGMYDVVIWAGHYGVPMPDADAFWAVVNATFEGKVNMIWLDSWGSYGYGIKALSTYTGDPASTSYNYGDGYVYVRVLNSHPILAGYAPGDEVLVIAYTDADYAWFNGFSGQVLAELVVGGQTKGPAIGVKVTEAGTKWILLASFVPTEWNDISYFTDEGLQIIVNAVEYALLQPINVTLSKTEAAVGDEVVVSVSGAKPNATYTVAFDGEEIATLETNADGEGSVTITVPTVPGGAHTISVYNYTLRQEGSATLTVVASITVSPASTIAPGAVTVSVTGLKPGEAFNIYLDANWISKVVADEKGAFEGLLNIPLVVTGTHTIGVYLDNGTLLASTTITVTSSLDEINSQLSTISRKINGIAGTVSTIIENAKGEIIAAINTQTGRVLAKIDNLNTSLAGLVIQKSGEIEALIDTEMGTVAASLDALNATITGVIQDQYGNIYAVLDTQFGKVLAKLDAVNATITGVVVDSKGEIIAKIDDGLGQVTVKLGDIQSAIDQLSAKIDQLPDQVSGKLGPKLDEASGQAKSAKNVAMAATGLSLVAIAGAAFSIFRRP